MIIEEFKNTPIAKLPYEYDVFDSDDEDKIKGTYTKDPRVEKG
jgi:hypothetical protein